MSALAGVLPRVIPATDGILTWEQIAPAIREKVYTRPQTALVALENTHNMAGGTVYPTPLAHSICDKAHAAGLKVHLDGARIFNAAVASETSVVDLTRGCDSVMFTLSKGLGAPAGSILLGTKDFIKEARIWRKRMGGGMRQVGILAAAGLIALEDGPARLHEDHANARRLAEELANITGIKIDLDSVVTNIVVFDIAGTGSTSPKLCSRLKEQNILAVGIDDETMRMVTHLDVSQADINSTLESLRDVLH
jgi:threonine aldolase